MQSMILKEVWPLRSFRKEHEFVFVRGCVEFEPKQVQQLGKAEKLRLCVVHETTFKGLSELMSTRLARIHCEYDFS